MQHGPLAICDFVVKIFTTDTAEAGRYEVSVESVAGDTEPISIHLDAEAMIDRRQELEHTLLSSAVRTRRAVPPNEQPLRYVGEPLFKAVFDGPIYRRYTASLATAQERDQSLRVVLNLPSELAALPWEAMFDGNEYICESAAGSACPCSICDTTSCRHWAIADPRNCGGLRRASRPLTSGKSSSASPTCWANT